MVNLLWLSGSPHGTLHCMVLLSIFGSTFVLQWKSVDIVLRDFHHVSDRGISLVWPVEKSCQAKPGDGILSDPERETFNGPPPSSIVGVTGWCIVKYAIGQMSLGRKCAGSGALKLTCVLGKGNILFPFEFALNLDDKLASGSAGHLHRKWHNPGGCLVEHYPTPLEVFYRGISPTRRFGKFFKTLHTRPKPTFGKAFLLPYQTHLSNLSDFSVRKFSTLKKTRLKHFWVVL